MMTWEESMLGVMEDLEQQATGLQLLERDADVIALAAAEYAHVALAERLHASVGRDLRLQLIDGHQLTGQLLRTGEDWLLLAGTTTQHVVRLAALVSVTGLSERADHTSTWSVLDRLTLRSVLRRLSDDAVACTLGLVGGHQVRGRLGRVGLDFVELYAGEDVRSLHVVPFAALVALQEQS